ncbi:sodium- and chloride-dependent GABA transporter 2-like [Liolophura sinensis]|uniref:sodium- and chloride-dependent GABA transporter 2-like n=1 Tax=Liolophura sinensis TaxID=3198878 RepID=UPI00315836A6
MDVHKEEPSKVRPEWGKKIDFLFVTVGSSVGLGNVWRFPYICYRNGGGVFLIPYLFAVLVIGIPVAFLEAGLGQFMSRGAVSAWKICPLFQGVGCAVTLLIIYTQCYYNVVMAWILYYLFSSFTTVLPWSHCGNEWNTVHCREHRGQNRSVNVTSLLNSSAPGLLGYDAVVASNSSNITHKVMDAATEFWERKVLGVSEGIEHAGRIKWELALCLLLAWVLVYLCIWKGIKITGKISYFTVTTPYILLMALLIRGVLLDGAFEGIRFYLLPDWSKLGKAQVWLEAGIQVFYSYTLGMSVHTALGSCNTFHHNSLRHLLIFVGVNTFTSFLSGFVIFSVLGFMATQQSLSISEVAGSGPGLAFVAYPEAMSQMPVAPLWSVLFFLTLIFVGIDSQFAHCEAFIIGISDVFPRLLRGSPNKEIFSGVMCFAWYLVGLSMVTEGGVYIQQLFEWYCGGRILMLVVFLECSVIAWIYGVSRFQGNMEYMLGYRLGPFLKFAWFFATPTVSFIMFTVDIVLYPEMTYRRKSGVYHFPGFARGIGWILSAAPLLCVPGMMIWRMCTAKGSLITRLKFLIKPEFDDVQMRRDKKQESSEKLCPEEIPMTA